MTEEQWLACPKFADAPFFHDAFTHLWPLTTDRKFRLFLCGGCRTMWHRLVNPECRSAVEVAEQFADGQASRRELSAAGFAVYHARAKLDIELVDRFNYVSTAVQLVNLVLDDPVVRTEAHGRRGGDFASRSREQFKLMRHHEWPLRALFHDIFGNPFRPVSIDPSWRTTAVVAIAKSMYESGDFAPMPLLADAFQDAGCADERILNHCQSPVPHSRGCWVVDRVLGKE